MGFFTDLQGMDCSPESMVLVAETRHAVEIDSRIYPGARYPAALNTPTDQIPLTLDELQRLAFEIDCAIKEILGFNEKDHS